MTSNQSDREISHQITADGSDTLYSPAYQETFHSTCGALTEANHVFLEGTGVKEQLQQRGHAHVLEVGFGTGLNFWLTARHSLSLPASLHYVALERDLLPAQTLAQLNHGAVLPQIRSLRQDFLEWRAGLAEPLPPGLLRWSPATFLRLDLIIGEASQIAIPNLAFEAIYLDAFSPGKNPELWTPDFLARLYAVLGKKGTLATYSASGEVRRNLQAAGFQVEKRPGSPGKREMLVAIRLR